MRQRRQRTTDAALRDVRELEACEKALQALRDRVKAVGAEKTVDAIRHAIKSIGGAIRHADGIHTRSQIDMLRSWGVPARRRRRPGEHVDIRG